MASEQTSPANPKSPRIELPPPYSAPVLVKETVSTTQAMLAWIKAIFSENSSINIIMATHLEPTSPDRSTTPNRPNDLTETTIASQCILPQKETDVAKMSLSATSARWSDLTVVCGDQTFEAHKVIVCSQVRHPS